MEPETGGDPERQENIDGSDQLSAAAEEPVARDSTETPNTEGRLETNGTDVISPDDSASTPRAVPQQLHGTASDSLVTPQRESDTDTLDFSIDASPSHFSAAPSRDLVVLVVHWCVMHIGIATTHLSFPSFVSGDLISACFLRLAKSPASPVKRWTPSDESNECLTEV